MDRLKKTRIPMRLQECLFVGVFSVYDAFLGNLLQQIFKQKPALYESIRSEMRTSEILKYSTIDQLKVKIVDDYVDDIRRKSYVDQFAHLEGLLGMPLRKFPNWPIFVEAAQRRNLLTHCDGIVSEQYLKVCAEVGYTPPVGKLPAVGSKLELDAEYFLKTCNIVQEVGIKLAHTLWRKLFPEELEIADEYLSDLVFENLKNDRTDTAICLGEFANSQKTFANDQWKLIIAVNYCIALLKSGDTKRCAALINSFDLSSALPEFKLAKAVLLRDFKKAGNVMMQIGKSGEFVNELHYHIWPLFWEFRSTSDFERAYKGIYGYDFITEVKKRVRATKKKSGRIKSLADGSAKLIAPAERLFNDVIEVEAPRKKRNGKKFAGANGTAS